MNHRDPEPCANLCRPSGLDVAESITALRFLFAFPIFLGNRKKT